MARIIAFLFLTVIPLLPQLITAVVTRAALAVGFGTASYVGFDILFDNVLSTVTDSLSGLPSDIVTMIRLVGIPTGINIALSSGFALLTFKGMSAISGRANIRKRIWRKPGDNSEMDWGA
ncbi:DUF2523 family protein [Vibrio litoralis]|uniref:DUF2523 family protein n=1 Tax=Vibrio litoralis TaxID=335972 RepID=UPI00040E9692|nr:DUF2523 family protein [Vibrio litoralis]